MFFEGLFLIVVVQEKEIPHPAEAGFGMTLCLRSTWGAEVAIRKGFADLIDNCFRESPLLLPNNHLITMSFRAPARNLQGLLSIVLSSLFHFIFRFPGHRNSCCCNTFYNYLHFRRIISIIIIQKEVFIIFYFNIWFPEYGGSQIRFIVGF
jgi:hypothetical protein